MQSSICHAPPGSGCPKCMGLLYPNAILIHDPEENGGVLQSVSQDLKHLLILWSLSSSRFEFNSIADTIRYYPYGRGQSSSQPSITITHFLLQPSAEKRCVVRFSPTGRKLEGPEWRSTGFSMGIRPVDYTIGDYCKTCSRNVRVCSHLKVL